jgi:protein-S-isoprenylcysteine O-methyltransferase Ste14
MRVGHELVTSGPYTYMRHPIYVGASVALFGTLLALGNALIVLIVPIVVLRFWWAARAENRLLAAQFGDRAEQR